MLKWYGVKHGFHIFGVFDTVPFIPFQPLQWGHSPIPLPTSHHCAKVKIIMNTIWTVDLILDQHSYSDGKYVSLILSITFWPPVLWLVDVGEWTYTSGTSLATDVLLNYWQGVIWHLIAIKYALFCIQHFDCRRAEHLSDPLLSFTPCCSLLTIAGARKKSVNRSRSQVYHHATLYRGRLCFE